MSSTGEQFEELTTEETSPVYSETAIDHSLHPRNVGNIQGADGFAVMTGPCGDTMEIWLKVRNGTITAASFLTDGCGTSIASGSMVTEIACGKTIAQAQKISQQDVLNALGGLPEESQHCALLASNTLKGAIHDYLAMQKEPWKRAYRNYQG